LFFFQLFRLYLIGVSPFVATLWSKSGGTAKVAMMKPLLFLCSALLCGLTGCSIDSAGHVATGTVKMAGKVATKTTVAAVKTGGQVAVTTTRTVVTTSSSIARTAVSAPVIIIKDTASGLTRQIPFSEGIRLYAAAQTSKFDLAMKTFALVRNGTPVMKSAWSKVKAGSTSDPLLRPGDIVVVDRIAKSKAPAKRV
jgi:hypothetical protein